MLGHLLSDPLWYWRRLRMMDLREIIGMRLYRGVRDRIPGYGPSAPAALTLTLPETASPRGASYRARFADRVSPLVREADRILDGHVTLFDRSFHLPDPIDWNQDPITRRRWPRVHATRLNYRAAVAGDPKDAWELNRHQFLPGLAAAYCVTEDERYAQRVLDVLESWIEDCPPFMGINWTSGIELAIRILSWSHSLALINEAPCFDARRRATFARSIHDQAWYLSEHLSLSSSSNNHLISELTALVEAGHLLNEPRWIDLGRVHLIDQIERQVLDDGVGAEQSPSYLCHTLEFYALAGLRLRERGRPLPRSVLDRMVLGARYVATLLESGGGLPMIGDNDSGVVLPLSTAPRDACTLITLIAHLADDPSLAHADAASDEKAHWLLGPGEVDELMRARPASAPEPRDAFPTGGAYVLESELGARRLKAVFDCGPLGMLPTAGHGHADALSFLLYVDGAPVLIDPGTYVYFKEPRWRAYFRGTSAHNTVRIDGQDQSVFGGPFLAVSRAQAGCLEWAPGRCVTGWHDGYERLPDPVRHIRTLRVHPEQRRLEVRDVFTGSEAHTVELFFHLHHAYEAHQTPRHNELSLRGPGGDVLVRLDERLEVRTATGDERRPLGWYSTMLGSKHPTTTLTGALETRGDKTLVTEFRL